jgi:indolepyruvate ferredoxin oxidoreductase beta subunit
MSYEDIIRVADLKTRRERIERVRAEAGAGPLDIVQIREHLSPRLEEIAAIAPLRVGRALRKRIRAGTPTGARGQGMSLHTTSVHGFLLLRLLASLRRWRPRSLRFAEEHAAIERWLAALRDVLPRHAGYALALAELPRLRKGYSDTFERGLAHYERIFDSLVAPCTAPTDKDAEALRQASAAALDIAPPPRAAPAPPLVAGQAQPVVWHTRESTLTAKGTTDP